MSWRSSLSSGWAKGLTLSAAFVLLLVTLTSGYSAGVCSMGKECHGDCCPCPQGMCVADTTHHDVVAAPGAVPSFRSIALAPFLAVPWHPSVAAAGFPALRFAALRSDPGRIPPGPSRSVLSVWLI
ncbi:MAG: hypothetical protein PW734_11120 [Verrucomicrobium sp.]|nr:hypothetical protein [Verrucomicrobium sp.]